MDGFNISKIINSLQPPEWLLKQLKQMNNINKMINNQQVNKFSHDMNSSITNQKPQNNQILENIKNINQITQNLQMNTFMKTDRLIFIRNLLGLPQNLQDVFMQPQVMGRPLNNGTLGLAGINQQLLQNSQVMATLFDENTPIPSVDNIIINCPGMSSKKSNDITALLFRGMVNLSEISNLILQNSKQAVAALIISMASASKHGVSNEQLQESLSIINSCIALAEADTPAQSLKSLMMLYLPWLPLNEGVGFDLEISTASEGDEANDSKLTVLIQTKHYGNLKGVFTLTTSNSVDVYIICSDEFPKKILEKALNEESSSHAMNTNIDIEELKLTEELKEGMIKNNQETKVNLSATNEMNPYLLLMAHSFIRNTILIDNIAG